MMDAEKLIERLSTESLYTDKANPEIMDLCMDAAVTIAALRVENQALRNAANGYKAECEKLRGKLSREKTPCTGSPFGGQENADCG